MRPVTPVPAQHRARLAGDLRRAGYIRGSFGPDGAAGTTWFETDLVVTRPGILRRCAALLEQGIPERTDRLAARGGPALALATALALQTWIPLLLWGPGELSSPGREQVPDGDAVQGELFPGARVVVVEDVVLTGAHALETIAELRRAETELIGVVGLLDREREGRFRIEEEGVTSFFAFRERDLLGG